MLEFTVNEVWLIAWMLSVMGHVAVCGREVKKQLSPYFLN
jgi:hypothetical protein